MKKRDEQRSYFYSMIDKVVDTFHFKTLNEAVTWAKTSKSKKTGKQMAIGISNTYFLKALVAQKVVTVQAPNKKMVMLIDCMNNDIRITIGTPSKTAPSFN